MIGDMPWHRRAKGKGKGKGNSDDDDDDATVMKKVEVCSDPFTTPNCKIWTILCSRLQSFMFGVCRTNSAVQHHRAIDYAAAQQTCI